MSLEEIAEKLNAEKIPTIHGTDRWTAVSGSEGIRFLEARRRPARSVGRDERDARGREAAGAAEGHPLSARTPVSRPERARSKRVNGAADANATFLH
jgi:hypothetical protein